MPTDLERIHEFIRRIDMVGTRHERFAYGTAVFLPALPLRHDSNYLWVERLPAADPVARLAGEADRLQGRAGVSHRMLTFPDATAVEPWLPAFQAAGWEVFRGVIQVQAPPTPAPLDTSRVVEADPAALRAARIGSILRYPWATPEVARQLIDARRFAPGEDRSFAVFEDEAPVAWAELYRDGPLAQVEAVATEPEHRRRGHASRIVTRCVEAARNAGAELVFLCADATGRARHLYERLGFQVRSAYVKCTRPHA